MKNVKLISLALSMLISFVLKAQEKTVNGKENSSEEKEIAPITFAKPKDTIPNVKVSSNFVRTTVRAPLIRSCASSISATKEPIYILDGEIINSSQFSKLNPSDIKGVKVLKGQDATSIYGNQAINGVVIITTKDE